MLVELSIIPINPGERISDEIVHAIRLVDASGLPYQVTASGTLIEGTWDEVMPLVRRCHEAVRARQDRVVTYVKIVDEAGATGKLAGNVRAVEERLGKRPERLTR